MYLRNTKEIGDSGEDLAVLELEKVGYEIIARNFRTRFGEVDIVAEDGRDLVFVEVKKKTTARFGTPAEMVTKAKQEKIKKMANVYIFEKKYRGPWRIDVVAILGECVEIIKNITL